MVWDYDPFIYDAESVTQMLNMELIKEAPMFSSPYEFPAAPPGNEENGKDDEQNSLPKRPGANFSRDTWWDALLGFYAGEMDEPGGAQIVTLTQAQRGSAMKSIVKDLRALLQAAPCWVSFLHIPRFFDSLFSPVRRGTLQPSLLLSALALGQLTQSSEVEKGRKGRYRSLKLLDMAHGALEGSLATGWVDIGLAQAALVSLLQLVMAVC